MTIPSRFLILMLGLAVTVTFTGLSTEVLSQEKKEEKKAEEKKVEEKKAEEKKAEEKKEEKKAEEKKVEPYVPDRAEIELKGHTDWINVVRFAADGNTVASASRDRTVRIWDLGQKKDVQTIKALASNPKGLAYHQDQVLFGVGKFNKEKKVREEEIKIVDAKSGKDIKSLPGHTDLITSLALNGDGQLLISGSEDQTAKIWELPSGKDTQTLKGHTGTIHGVAITADGNRAATASEDRTVKLWEARTGKEIATLKTWEKETKTTDPKSKKETVTKEQGRPFTTVAFSPDGKFLAAGTMEGTIKIFDVADQKEIRELKAHEGVWALAYSPDGSKLASGGWDQTIKIWDAATGADRQTIKAHVGTVTTLQFSPNSQRLVSGGLDGLVKIWALAK